MRAMRHTSTAFFGDDEAVPQTGDTERLACPQWLAKSVPSTTGPPKASETQREHKNAQDLRVAPELAPAAGRSWNYCRGVCPASGRHRRGGRNCRDLLWQAARGRGIQQIHEQVLNGRKRKARSGSSGLSEPAQWATIPPPLSIGHRLRCTDQPGRHATGRAHLRPAGEGQRCALDNPFDAPVAVIVFRPEGQAE
jgi:hypothetical protein